MATKSAKKAVVTKSGMPPKGMQRIASGGFANIHDFKKSKVLHGKVTELKSVTTQKKVKGKLVSTKTRIMSVADMKTGEITSVWEKAALAGLFDAVQKKPRKGIGAIVWIMLAGRKVIKKGQQPMYMFETAIG